jgi:hypothetical protein
VRIFFVLINRQKTPELWIQALDLLIKSSSIDEEKILAAVKSIDRLGLISPIEIVNMMSQNEHLTIGIIRDFIIQKISEEQAIITQVLKPFVNF